jgi:hypothetical protein
MNRNITAIILIVLAIGIYFTFTSAKVKELQAIRAVNSQYQKAIDDSNRLILARDSLLKSYDALDDVDKDRLNKIVPNNVDNVRLIIDVKDDIAARHGLALKNIKTSSPDAEKKSGGVSTGSNTGTIMDSTANTTPSSSMSKYGMVTLSFTVTTDYTTFTEFLKDLESSLRIMDVTKLVVNTNDAGKYDFTVDIRTYWLR